MQTQRIWRMVQAVALALAMAPASAAADAWNERTELKFSSPIMVPGATLEPGTYVFKLAEIRGDRHIVQVLKQDSGEIVSITQAVPTHRPEPVGDTVLTFNPTERGIPALKGWYYPGSSYGHEFIYPEEEARLIAERSKTIVLSGDIAGSDLEKGTLRLYHPSGERTAWRADARVAREWDAWQRSRGGARADERAAGERDDADDGRGDPRARAPMVMSKSPGERVAIDDLESDPTKYLGRTISVDAEVEEVYGPRLFTIDEPHWGDLEGEILVYAPSILAALVKDDDRVTVTGTLKNVATADIEREWGWFELEPDVEVEFAKKPVLIAERIVGGNNNLAMLLDFDSDSEDREAAVTTEVIVDPATVANATTDHVGRHVNLKNVRVLRMAHGGGFFVDLPGGSTLVLPAMPLGFAVAPGDRVSLIGAIAATPRRTAERVNPPMGWNNRVYIVATDVRK